MASLTANAQIIHRGLAILIESFKSKGDLKEFAQELDDGAVPALERVIDAVNKSEDLALGSLPEEMQEEYCAFELALDAAELLAYKVPLTSIPLIVRLFREMLKEDDELLSDYGADLVGIFPPETASIWMNQVRPSKGACTFESVILDGIGTMVEGHVSIQQDLAPKIVQLLTSANLSSPNLNGQLVSLACQWHLTEAAAVIERAFSQNLVDCGYPGTWEVVREQLDVEGLGLPMPQRPVNFIAEFRLKMGIGTFSNVALFSDREIDEDAKDAYLNKACESFQRSEWARHLKGNSCGTSVRCFLDLGLCYFGVHVDNMTLGKAKEILLECFPSIVSQPADQADQTIDELVAFWNYCDQVHKIEHAADLSKKINAWRQKFREAMGSPDNFNAAKSIVMSGMVAGFDMTTEAGTAAYLKQFNAARSDAAFRRMDSAVEFQSISPQSFDSPREQSQPINRSLKERKKLLKRLKRK